MRKGVVKRQITLPDPKFGEVQVTRFVNNMMMSGKKSLSLRLFYQAVEIIESKVEDVTGLEVFQKGLANVTPAVEVRSRRVGGSTFQIPQPIRDSRKESMAMKWMISFARKRNEKSFSQKLAGEILAAYKEEGAAFKKKEDVHRMADANKAFSHFRF